MSVTFHYHHEAQLALLAGAGPLERAEWLAAVAAMVASNPPGGVHRVLSDRRQMVGRYPAWMENLVADGLRSHGAALGALRWAVLLPPRLADQATVVQESQARAGIGVSIRAFTDLEAALGWLLGYIEPDELTALQAWVDAAGGTPPGT